MTTPRTAKKRKRAKPQTTEAIARRVFPDKLIGALKEIAGSVGKQGKKR
jgi:hypothetical protein